VSIRILKEPEGLFALKSDAYSKALYIAARETPGLTWNADERRWEGMRDAVATCAAALTAKGIRLIGETPPHIPNDAVTRFVASYDSARDYQRVAIDFLVTHADEGALLADDMGLGKSLVALRAARAFKEPTLVVCPAFVTGIWGDDESSETRKWWCDAWPPRVLEGTKAGPWVIAKNDGKERQWYWRPDGWTTAWYHADLFRTMDDAEIFAETKWSVEERKRLGLEYLPAALPSVPLTVCNYSILHAWAPHLTGAVKTLIADEAHYISNSKSERTKAMASIAAGCKYRIALTGTPLTNRPRDLWSLVDTISLGRFGKFFSFGVRYADGKQEEVPQRGSKLPKTVWRFDGASNLEELNKRLSYFMLRRTKKDVGLELPPRTMQAFMVNVKRGFIAPPKSILGDKQVSEKALRRALDLAADGKLPHIVELVKTHVDSGSRVVVFCWRRSVCEYLAEALAAAAAGPTTFIHGAVSLKERQRRIAANWRVLCANIDVTAGGISLTRASVGVYAELTWEPHEILQTMARMHRPGQEAPTQFIFPLARGSVDELLAKTLLSKLATFETVIGAVDERLDDTFAATREKTAKAQLKSLYDRLKKQQSD